MIYNSIIDVLGTPADAFQANTAYVFAGITMLLICIALLKVIDWVTHI